MSHHWSCDLRDTESPPGGAGQLKDSTSDTKSAVFIVFEETERDKALDVAICSRTGDIQSLGDLSCGDGNGVISEHVEHVERSLSGGISRTVSGGPSCRCWSWHAGHAT